MARSSTIRIAHLTDSHLVQSGICLGVDPLFTLNRVLNKIQSLELLPDLMIVTGDLTDGGARETYVRFRDALDSFEIPIYVVPGNHDLVSNMNSAFLNSRIRCIEHLQLEYWNMLFIDSTVAGKSYGLIAESELARMEIVLTENQDRPYLVALHHSAMTNCGTSNCQIRNRDQLMSTLAPFSNVRIVLSGHLHSALQAKQQGIEFLTSPSTCAQLSHSNLESTGSFWNSHVLDNGRAGFSMVELLSNGDTRINIHWVELS